MFSYSPKATVLIFSFFLVSNLSFSRNIHTFYQKEDDDTIINVNFTAPQQITTETRGPKDEVLNELLVNVNILPTNGMLALIEKLNPEIRNRKNISAGTIIKLPEFRMPDPQLIDTLRNQILLNHSVNELDNALFAERSKMFHSILHSTPRLHELPELNATLQEIEKILTDAIERNRVRLKKYHTDILNGELEKLNNYLLNLNNLPGEINTEYINAFKRQLVQILISYSFLTSRLNFHTQNLYSGLVVALSLSNSIINHWAENAFYRKYDASIHVFPNITTNGKQSKAVVSDKQYWVYCLSKVQMQSLHPALMNMDDDQLKNINAAQLNKLITIANLKRETRCMSPASVAVYSLDMSYAYHFIVFSRNNLQTILIHDWINIKTLPKHTPDIGELWGIGLYEK